MRVVLLCLTSLASPAGAQNALLRTIPPNTARDLGVYECTTFTELGGHALPDCRTITDYGGMVYDPTRARMLIWGGGHAATYRDDVEAFDLSTLRWAPDAPPTPCDELTLDNVDPLPARWISSNHPISRHAYDLLVVVPPREELWMLARMQGRGRGCNRLPPPDEDAGIPYVLGEGRFAAYRFDSRTWHFTDVESAGFQTGAEYDPISGRILLVNRWGIRWFDPETETLTSIVSFDPPLAEMDTGSGLQLVYHQALDRFYVLMTRPRKADGGGVWEIRLDREQPDRTTLQKLEVAIPDPAPGGRDGWVYDEVNEIFVGGITDGVVFAFDPRTRQWYQQVAEVDSPDGAAIGTLVSKTIAYEPESGVVIFRARTRGPGGSERTWAYRWGGDPPPLDPGRDGGTTDGAVVDGGATVGDGSISPTGPVGSAAGDPAAPPGCTCGQGGTGRSLLGFILLALTAAVYPGRRRHGSRQRRDALEPR